MDLNLHTGTGLSSVPVGSHSSTQGHGIGLGPQMHPIYGKGPVVAPPAPRSGPVKHPMQHLGPAKGSNSGSGPGPVMPVSGKLIYYGLALAGGTAAGVLMTGESAMDVATALNGALGAVVGLAIGNAAEKSMSSSYASYLPLVGAVAVPALAGGQLDMVVGTIGVAGYGATMLSDRF